MKKIFKSTVVIALTITLMFTLSIGFAADDDVLSPRSISPIIVLK